MRVSEQQEPERYGRGDIYIRTGRQSGGASERNRPEPEPALFSRARGKLCCARREGLRPIRIVSPVADIEAHRSGSLSIDAQNIRTAGNSKRPVYEDTRSRYPGVKRGQVLESELILVAAVDDRDCREGYSNREGSRGFKAVHRIATKSILRLVLVFLDRVVFLDR